MPTLSLPAYATSIEQAVRGHSGQQLAVLLALTSPDGSGDKHQSELLDFMGRAERGQYVADRWVGTFTPSYEGYFKRNWNKGLMSHGPWAEIAAAHVGALVNLHAVAPGAVPGQHVQLATDFVVVYAKQHEIVTSLYRYLLDARDSTRWALPVLYQVCKDLKKVAEQADQQLLSKQQKATKLEEASRLLQKCFSLCLNDRSELKDSKKYGTYYLATLLFKVYFKLNSTALCRNIIRGIGAAELPPLESFPRAHQVTYLYYMGVFAFLREDYAEAERKFTEALEGCHRLMKGNREKILDYLIPLLLLRGVHPSDRLYTFLPKPSPGNPRPQRELTRHYHLYAPFAAAIKSGNVAAYDRQLERAEKTLMRRGTYLVVERAREAAVRGAVKKAWILSGKPARMPISTFVTAYNAAQRLGTDGERGEEGEGAAQTAGVEIDAEECECLLANLIAKGLMKGYISHAHQLVVLSKDKPFPWYAPCRPLDPAKAKARAEKEAAERAKMPVFEGDASAAGAGGATA
ncbi:hypothetical protein JCM10213_000039 [Rhodosporidiobolus nylandii]